MFKVGDIVRVKKNLRGRNTYGGVYFNYHMQKFIGRTFRVVSVNLEYIDGYETVIYGLIDPKYNTDVDAWIFSTEMLEYALNVNKLKEFIKSIA